MRYKKNKNVQLKLQITFILLLISYSKIALAQESFLWPNNAKAAVNLAYDDALPSQLDNAIPALNKHGFKGSFYLVLSAKIITERRDEWRAIAKQGHELGNHSIYHACSKSLPNRQWVDDDNNLDTKSVKQVQEEVISANELLHAIDGESIRTFTVPCTDVAINGENYVKGLKSQFVGIKYSVGEVPLSMMDMNPLQTPVITPVNSSGAELIAAVKKAAKYGTVANFTFHGIGGDHLSVSTQAHDELLAYLAKHKDIYWVDTFRNISLYINDNIKSNMKKSK